MAKLKPITGRKIRIAILGCGRISDNHFHAIKKHSSDIDLVAICDTDKEKVKQASEKTGAKGHTDLEEMLSKEKLDMVTVATPNGLHPRHVMQVANHHIHVLTEKPMAVKLEDGLKMQAFCEEKGVELYVLYQNRFNETCQALYRARQEDRFGKIYLMASNVFWMRPQSYYEGSLNWHGTRDIDGGPFFTQASHYVDLMMWIAGGGVKSIYANLKTLGRKIETEDTGVVNIEWDNGTLGSLNVTMLTYPKNLEGSLTILGEKGSVRIGGIAMNEIQLWDFAQGSLQDQEAKVHSYQTDSVYGPGHVTYYQHIIAAFRGEKVPLVTGREGLESLKFLDAIMRSNSLGSPVSL